MLVSATLGIKIPLSEKSTSNPADASGVAPEEFIPTFCALIDEKVKSKINTISIRLNKSLVDIAQINFSKLGDNIF